MDLLVLTTDACVFDNGEERVVFVGLDHNFLEARLTVSSSSSLKKDGPERSHLMEWLELPSNAEHLALIKVDVGYDHTFCIFQHHHFQESKEKLAPLNSLATMAANMQ